MTRHGYTVIDAELARTLDVSIMLTEKHDQYKDVKPKGHTGRTARDR